jgi:hypothetical protein
LTLAARGGEIRTAAVSSVKMSGDLHEFLEEAIWGEWATYNGSPLAEGSIRIQGVRNRDLVTVVGYKTGAGDLRPERLHGGDRVSLENLLRTDIKVLRIVGSVLLILGGGGLAVIGFLTWRSYRWRR